MPRILTGDRAAISRSKDTLPSALDAKAKQPAFAPPKTVGKGELAILEEC